MRDARPAARGRAAGVVGGVPLGGAPSRRRRARGPGVRRARRVRAADHARPARGRRRAPRRRARRRGRDRSTTAVRASTRRCSRRARCAGGTCDRTSSPTIRSRLALRKYVGVVVGEPTRAHRRRRVWCAGLGHLAARHWPRAYRRRRSWPSAGRPAAATSRTRCARTPSTCAASVRGHRADAGGPRAAGQGRGRVGLRRGAAGRPGRRGQDHRRRVPGGPGGARRGAAGARRGVRARRRPGGAGAWGTVPVLGHGEPVGRIRPLADRRTPGPGPWRAEWCSPFRPYPAGNRTIRASRS